MWVQCCVMMSKYVKGEQKKKLQNYIKMLFFTDLEKHLIEINIIL